MANLTAEAQHRSEFSIVIGFEPTETLRAAWNRIDWRARSLVRGELLGVHSCFASGYLKASVIEAEILRGDEVLKLD